MFKAIAVLVLVLVAVLFGWLAVMGSVVLLNGSVNPMTTITMTGFSVWAFVGSMSLLSRLVR